MTLAPPLLVLWPSQAWAAGLALTLDLTAMVPEQAPQCQNNSLMPCLQDDSLDGPPGDSLRYKVVQCISFLEVTMPAHF